MDRLAIESDMALKAGMSYGKWKALNKPVEIVMPERKNVMKRTCEYCGDEYWASDRRARKYCGVDCMKKASQKKLRERMRERRANGKK